MNPENQNHWVFRLFVSGENPNTGRTISLLEQICEEHLEEMCDIQVIDVFKDPFSAMDEDIIATPTLLKKLPKPERRIIGNLSDKEKLLSGLEIYPNLA